MRKPFFKSIAAALTIVATLLSSSVPVIAAEQNSVMDNITISTQAVESADSLDSVNAMVGEFHYTGRLSANKYLGMVEITGSAKSVRSTAGRTGSDGLIRIQLTNVNTGDFRTFSVVANNTLETDSFVTALSAGVWEVTVIYVSSGSLYDVDLYFYS